MIQSPRDLSEADSLGVLAADALNDVRRDRGAAAQSRDSGARFARLLGALGEVALELGEIVRDDLHGASRARTGDLLGAIQALSQLSYSPAIGEV